MLEKTVELTLLCDFYGALLTERQRQFVELYYQYDLSLGEISENAGVTRQAVYDILQRAERSLRGYEDALGLLEQYRRRQDAVGRCVELLQKLRSRDDQSDSASKLVDELAIIIDEELS